MRAISRDWKEVEGLYNENLNDKEIALETGFSPSTIMKWRLKRGLPATGSRTQRRNFKNIFEENLSKILDLYFDEAPIKSIARVINIPYHVFKIYLQGRGLDTSTKRIHAIRADKLYEYLDKNGPGTYRELKEIFNWPNGSLTRIIRYHLDVFERIKLSIGTKGSFVHTSIELFGRLSYNQAGWIVALRNRDDDLIRFLFRWLPFRIYDRNTQQTFSIVMNSRIGRERNSKLIELMRNKCAH